MTKDYIEREAALAFVKKAWGKGLNPVEYLEEVPAADVRPVVRGEWICLYDGNYKCSECGEWYSVDVTPIEEGMFYCPNCGADMRGEDNV